MNPSANINEIFAGISLKNLPLEQILYTLVTFLLGVLIIQILLKMLRRIINRPAVEQRTQRYVVSAVRVILWVILLLILADQLGIPTTSLVALLSVLSLAISLAIQNVLSNIAGGLVILTTKPFQIGDYIDTPSGRGVVKNISLHSTYLTTDDGQQLIVPNSTISADKITNFTANGSRRIVVTVSASYDAPTATVRQACLAAVAATPHILEDPAPEVLVNAYGDNSIEYLVRVWCLPDKYNEVFFPLTEHIREAFIAAKVEMTYPHLNVHLKNQ